MKTILLAGYRTSENSEAPLGLERETGSGQRMLDARIHQLSQLGFEIITVLSGAQADEQLRLCPRIANTELVFDTSDHIGLASNVKQGLLAVGEAEGCYVLPVEIPPAPADLWRALRTEWGRIGFTTEIPLFQAVDGQGAPWHFGFPLLITHTGNQLIRGLNDFRGLTDPRLLYTHVVYDPQSAVAPGPKAL